MVNMIIRQRSLTKEEIEERNSTMVRQHSGNLKDLKATPDDTKKNEDDKSKNPGEDNGIVEKNGKKLKPVTIEGESGMHYMDEEGTMYNSNF